MIFWLPAILLPATFNYVVGQEAIWSEWQPWGPCSKTCDYGTQVRYRGCVPWSGLRCHGRTGRLCIVRPCFPNRGSAQVQSDKIDQLKISWLEWQPWSDCSVSCGGGARKRIRTCHLPNELVGCKKTENKGCNMHACESPFSESAKVFQTTTMPMISWSNWGNWGGCSKTCGIGVEERKRTCIGRRGLCGSRDTQRRTCSSKMCHPEWLEWGEWSWCSTTCGKGSKRRRRICNDRSHNCFGRDIDVAPCKIKECQEEPERSEWSPWSACSKTCGMGMRLRFWPCFDEQKCDGTKIESEDCMIDECGRKEKKISRAEEWSHWETWSQCYGLCGVPGWNARTRICNGGREGKGNCQGPNYEHRACKTECEVESHWGAWGPWTDCSVACGGGKRYKSRSCKNLSKTCKGPGFVSQNCNIMRCNTVV